MRLTRDSVCIQRRRSKVKVRKLNALWGVNMGELCLCLPIFILFEFMQLVEWFSVQCCPSAHYSVIPKADALQKHVPKNINQIVSLSSAQNLPMASYLTQCKGQNLATVGAAHYSKLGLQSSCDPFYLYGTSPSQLWAAASRPFCKLLPYPFGTGGISCLKRSSPTAMPTLHGPCPSSCVHVHTASSGKLWPPYFRLHLLATALSSLLFCNFPKAVLMELSRYFAILYLI